MTGWPLVAHLVDADVLVLLTDTPGATATPGSTWMRR
jgi:glutamate 5-kinase